MERRTQRRSGKKRFCPVAAWARACQRVRRSHNNAFDETPVCSIQQHGEEPRLITLTAIIESTYPIPANGSTTSPAFCHNQEFQKRLKRYLCSRGNVTKAILEKVFTLHPIQNAWHTISFGSNSHIIYQAALDDPMHYHCSGLIA